MTVHELAAKLEADGRNHRRKGVRRRCTPERCMRVAKRALADQAASEAAIVEFCASEEPRDSREHPSAPIDESGYGFAWLTLLLPIIQLVLQFLASRAKAHIAAE